MALTYARRYALFTLVGIAGEDDLDAPDLCSPGSSSTAPPPARSIGNGRGSAFGKATPPALAVEQVPSIRRGLHGSWYVRCSPGGG
jgi:hypothetical protein